jgi:methionyl-tRNA formyltransferase
MAGIVALSTNTPHHRYMFNVLRAQGIELAAVIFESGHVEPSFTIGPVFEAEEAAFEAEMFGEQSIDWLPSIEVENINQSESLEAITERQPDIAVVFGTRRLSDEIINLFPDGLLNVHRGIAQKYRGLDSDLWTIYHKDYASLGVTVHRVESELDTGEVVGQRNLTLHHGMKCHELRHQISVIATDLMVLALQDHRDGNLTSRPQGKIGRYYSFMPRDLKEICQRRFNKYCLSLPK